MRKPGWRFLGRCRVVRRNDDDVGRKGQRCVVDFGQTIENDNAVLSTSGDVLTAVRRIHTDNLDIYINALLRQKGQWDPSRLPLACMTAANKFTTNSMNHIQLHIDALELIKFVPPTSLAAAQLRDNFLLQRSLRVVPAVYLHRTCSFLRSIKLLDQHAARRLLGTFGLIAITSKTVDKDLLEEDVLECMRLVSECNDVEQSRYDALLHGCNALVCLQREDIILKLYGSVSKLPPSPALVQAHLARGDVHQALVAFDLLVKSRSEWKTFPIFVMSTVMETAHAVGYFYRGDRDSSMVDALMRSVLTMSATSSSFLSGRVVESVVTGLTSRIESLCRNASERPADAVHPIKVTLEEIVAWIGVDVNLDPFLSLLDAALAHPTLGVPLTVAIVGVLEACGHERCSVASLWGGDKVLRGYVLADANAAADRSHTQMEHLLSVWGDVPSLTMNETLWMCHSCKKRNSWRYSFCSCSAFRFGRATCDACGFLQDERAKDCMVCSTRLLRSDMVPLITRDNWKCRSCGANNGGLSDHSCSKCGGDKWHPFEEVQKICKDCGSASRRSPTQEPFCPSCGSRAEHFTNETSHQLWFCDHCKGFHCVTDVSCPHGSCVELTAASLRRSWNAVTCPECQHCHSSPFATKCVQCASDISMVSVKKNEDADCIKDGMLCVACGGVNIGAFASGQCQNCMASLQDAEYCQGLQEPVPLCRGCTYQNKPGSLSLVCEGCGKALKGARVESWSWGIVLTTLKHLLRHRAEGDEIFHVLERFVARESELEQASQGVQNVLLPMLLQLRNAWTKTKTPLLLSRRLQAMSDGLWRKAQSGRLNEGECLSGCMHCGGGHPSSCCQFATPNTWKCSECNSENRLDGLNAYLCFACVTFRSEVFHLARHEGWQCHECSKINVEFDSHCIYCGVDRTKEELDESQRVPVVPMTCSNCGEVFLESSCPTCQHDGVRQLNAATGGQKSPSPPVASPPSVHSTHQNRGCCASHAWDGSRASTISLS